LERSNLYVLYESWSWIPTSLRGLAHFNRGSQTASAMFQSEAGSPVDPRNALNRYFRPAAKTCGITVSGWHDFRHTLSTNLRRKKQHPKVVTDILGHRR